MVLTNYYDISLPEQGELGRHVIIFKLCYEFTSNLTVHKQKNMEYLGCLIVILFLNIYFYCF